MQIRLLSLLLISTALYSCGNAEQAKQEKANQVDSLSFTNKGHELVYKMVETVGNYQALSNKKDVVYTYQYKTPDGKEDVSTEKYIFDGELSYGAYIKHDRTFPDLEGLIEQGYDGKEFWLKNKGEVVQDSVRLKRVAFNRPTNFYWFAMFQKMLDPGLTYELLEDKEVGDSIYYVVRVGFEPTPNKASDIYQLYINKRTMLVDFFLFTVADFGVLEEPYVMHLAYEEIDEILIPSKRKYKKSTWDADTTAGEWVMVNWTDIKFNQGLTKADFSK